VSAEKTASERRLDEFKAQQEAQLRDNQKNDEIAAIKTAEETKKQEIVEEVAKEKAKEINDFLATPNGKALVKKSENIKQRLTNYQQGPCSDRCTYRKCSQGSANIYGHVRIRGKDEDCTG